MIGTWQEGREHKHSNRGRTCPQDSHLQVENILSKRVDSVRRFDVSRVHALNKPPASPPVNLIGVYGSEFTLTTKECCVYWINPPGARARFL